ncbi:MAG: serine/threonine protein phosphatase [Rhodobacteraceae bacterium]|nr:serine/threonine protein phosphatase [Paracoccaceae bacterium]
MSFLSALFKRRSPPAPPRSVGPAVFEPPCPDQPLYVIGDIHGRIDLLDRLLEKIEDDAGALVAEMPGADPRLIFVGDYIDRGDHSRAVLERVYHLHKEGDGRVICLQGNHEKLMLDFIDIPEKGPRWLRHGGLQTLMSLGLGGALAEGMDADELIALSRDVHRVLPDGVEDWLRDLPLSWQSGSVWTVHAGADPTKPMAEQASRVLLWGHRDFDTVPRSDGAWVVHGHTVVDAAIAAEGRISIDTGGVYTGRLSAARILPGSVRFLGT